MNANLKKVTQRFLSLNMRHKMVFLAMLCLLLCISIGVSMYFFTTHAQKVRQILSLSAEQTIWLEKSEQIEEELKIFSRSGTYRNIDVAQIEAAVESIAVQTGCKYTITEMDKGQLEKFTIFRLRVSLSAISLAKLVEFFNATEAVDNNVAISGARVVARDGNVLDAQCIVSILDIG
jgi:hypothetical protein